MILFILLCFPILPFAISLYHQPTANYTISKKRKNVHIHMEKRKKEMQLRGRIRYSQMSTEKREAVMLARRMRKQNAISHNLDNQTTSTSTKTTPTSSMPVLSNQPTVVIQECSPSTEKDYKVSSKPPQLVLEKGKLSYCTHIKPYAKTKWDNKDTSYKGKTLGGVLGAKIFGCRRESGRKKLLLLKNMGVYPMIEVVIREGCCGSYLMLSVRFVNPIFFLH